MIDLNEIKFDFLEKCVKESSTFAELIRKIDYRGGGTYLKNLKIKLKNSGVDYSHIEENIKNQYREKDLAGKTFGHWTVIARAPKKGIHNAWLCKCECGREKNVYQTHLIQGNSKSCKNVGCQFVKSGETHSQWKGIGDISGDKLYCIQNGASKRNIPFEITKEYIWELFIKQNKKCALSGVDIDFGIQIGPEDKQEQATASLDRIDNSKGYIIGNVWWVHRDINWMKNTFKLNHFIKLCNLVSSHTKKTNDLGYTMKDALEEKKEKETLG